MRELDALVEVLDHINAAILSLSALGLGTMHLRAERYDVLNHIMNEYVDFQERYSYVPELRPDVVHAISYDPWES